MKLIQRKNISKTKKQSPKSILPVANNKNVCSNTETENTSVDFNMLNYPEESVNSNYTGNKSKWNSDSTTDISDYDSSRRDSLP